MIIPKKLKIGGHTIKVSFVDELTNDAYGEFHEGTGTIKLIKAQTATGMQCTLIHEILHALCLNWSEEHVELTAQALYQVLSENNLTFDKEENK